MEWHQGFIILAMLMLLYDADKDTVQNRKLKFLIFAVTLLTTQSSTGYILFVVILLTQWQRIQAIFGDELASCSPVDKNSELIQG